MFARINFSWLRRELSAAQAQVRGANNQLAAALRATFRPCEEVRFRHGLGWSLGQVSDYGAHGMLVIKHLKSCRYVRKHYTDVLTATEWSEVEE